MTLSELREQIDAVDTQLLALLERRMDVAAGIADYKQAVGKPVLDAAREREKLAAVRAQCRPETADGIVSIFEAVLSASRAHQTQRMEKRHGG